jgi:hypothetical protein
MVGIEIEVVRTEKTGHGHGEALPGRRLTSRRRTHCRELAIAGASNGGLRIGACMTQRPDLFQVARPAAGVMDMLRFHKFMGGWGWVGLPFRE